MADDARTRWHAFLGKIEARHAELLDGAREALPGLVPASGFDLQPFSVAMMAVRAQCIGLAQKIDQTFSASAEAALEAADLDTGPEQARGHALSWRLELALRTAEVEISGAAADVVVARAMEVLGSTFKCTRCGAALAVPRTSFRASYVACTFCSAVNTFEPGIEVRQVEHFAVPALVDRATWALHRTFLEAEQAWRSQRGDVGRDALVARYLQWVDAWLAARVRLLPHLEKDLAADRKAKHDGFVDSLG